MKKIIAMLLALMMVLSMAACEDQQDSGSTPSVTTSTNTPSENVGVAFTVIVKDLDGSEETFQYTSKAATVGEALLEKGLIAGDESEWGLMVHTVNGITADWATENAYWAFYINGEYAQTGVDATPLTEGVTYTFEKTVSYTEKGDGATSFYFTVKNVDNTVTKFLVHTNKTTVGSALLELGLITGDESEYGLYVTSVNGLTADWATENAYWAFYINGEYGQTGVDSTKVVAGATYEMVKTISYTKKGEGATSFYFTVRNVDNTVTKFIIHTNKTTVGAALLELGLIEGEDSEYGLMVKSVNGITADWETEKAYWAFYINGEYAQTGVDSTGIVADAVYEMVKTISEE